MASKHELSSKSVSPYRLQVKACARLVLPDPFSPMITVTLHGIRREGDTLLASKLTEVSEPKLS